MRNWMPAPRRRCRVSFPSAPGHHGVSLLSSMVNAFGSIAASAVRPAASNGDDSVSQIGSPGTQNVLSSPLCTVRCTCRDGPAQDTIRRWNGSRSTKRSNCALSLPGSGPSVVRSPGTIRSSTSAPASISSGKVSAKRDFSQLRSASDSGCSDGFDHSRPLLRRRSTLATASIASARSLSMRIRGRPASQRSMLARTPGRAVSVLRVRRGNGLPAAVCSPSASTRVTGVADGSGSPSISQSSSISSCQTQT